jgi:FixJ family two-component response regulator
MISIVDDDSSVREAMLDLSGAMDFAAAAFPSAKHFLESEDVHRTACLITDMRMPGMSGLELHDHLVAAGIVIPTIVITAFPDERDRARAFRAGVVGYLPKPFCVSELLDCINASLKKS